MNTLVWTYHRVLPEASPGAVRAEVFEKQIASLAKSGHRFIGTSDLEVFLKVKLPHAEKCTMLTFDDGWADNLIWATPILKKYSAKAVLALNTGFINKNFCEIRNSGNYKIINSKEALGAAAYGRDYSSFLTWNEVQEMKKSGVWEIQAHGNSHYGCYDNFDDIRGFYPDKQHWTMEFALGEPPFPGAPRTTFRSILSDRKTVLCDDLKTALRQTNSDRKRKKLCKNHSSPLNTIETPEEFEKRVRDDLTSCRKAIKENLGQTPDCLFWPWGHYSDSSVKIAKECGFKMLFTMEKDAVTEKTPTDKIPRIAAPADFADFQRQLTIYANPLLRSFRMMLP
ncbi:MAG: polysaccharide deacetylase family protein [Lentisphaerae bacterium]|nr:polysaccharide deacetylase family protein [Lentisphaerota bacterium]